MSPRGAAPCPVLSPGGCPLPWSSEPPPSPATGVPLPQKALQKLPTWKHNGASSDWVGSVTLCTPPGHPEGVPWLHQEQDPNASGCPQNGMSVPTSILTTSPTSLAPVAHMPHLLGGLWGPTAAGLDWPPATARPAGTGQGIEEPCWKPGQGAGAPATRIGRTEGTLNGHGVVQPGSVPGASLRTRGGKKCP